MLVIAQIAATASPQSREANKMDIDLSSVSHGAVSTRP